jgi:hypothetical protein
VTLSELVPPLIAYLSAKSDVTDVQLVLDEPGHYIYGFLCDGHSVSLSISYTQ